MLTGVFVGFPAQQPSQPFGAAIFAGHARTDHGEIERPHGGGDFQLEVKIGGVMRAGIEDVLQRTAIVRRHTVDQQLGAVAVEMQWQDLDRAVPDDRAFGNIPVEHGGAGGLCGKPQARIVMNRADLRVQSSSL